MRIAIIGKDSYIGNALDDYATTQGHTVFQVDALDGKWKTFDFSGIDAVVCVAAIVHRKDITDYLVYHRINKNYIEKDKGPGWHREVCIDKMEFNEDGTIKRVVPNN